MMTLPPAVPFIRPWLSCNLREWRPRLWQVHRRPVWVIVKARLGRACLALKTSISVRQMTGGADGCLLMIAVVGAGPSPLQQHERSQITKLQSATPVASPARLALGAEQPSAKRHVATVRPACRMLSHMSLDAILVEALLQGLLKTQHSLVYCKLPSSGKTATASSCRAADLVT